ncbi:glycosyltransferase family 4 protein [Metabacillus halosaccharovorans]|uniref:glycosyltransferase n=1 Tax=Metabacillus halosaccharovorans TaxID=930124 RepID=UPI00403DB5A9
MKIAMLSTAYESTPPKRYGGTERVVSLLTEGLIERGHEVTLFATGNSKTGAKLISIYEDSTVYHPAVQLVHSSKSFEYINSNSFDIVHNHVDYAICFTPFCKVPMVTTLHNDITNKNKQILFQPFSDANYVAISNRHSNNAKNNNLNIVSRIYNSTNINNFTFSHNSGTYLAFLGNILPYKGPDIAIEIAKRTGTHLKIAGKIGNIEFFKEKIEPHIDNKLISYVGELNDKEKDNFLNQASALLFPINWKEPFGLVMIESMACGTPVIAFNRGSVTEIVVHEKTGFIVDNIKGMVEAVQRINNINRIDCRRHVEERFDRHVMISEYEKLYSSLI